VTGVRAQLAVACAAVAVVMPFLAVANASGTSKVAPTQIVASRQSRTSGVGIAGGSLYVWSSHRSDQHGGACTAGFAVEVKGTKKKGLLTAGHCVKTLSGGPIYQLHQTTNLPKNATDPGKLLAEVHAGAYRMGKYGDSAFGRVASGRSVRPYVFVGDTKSKLTIPVVGRMAPAYGMQVCYSGASSGEHCGFTIGRRQSVKFAEGSKLVTISHEYSASSSTGCTSVKGDSGSPVYVRDGNSAYAVGILSGGQDKAGQCPFYFTSISLALKQLNLVLLKGKA
jgi:hypothetical protein